MAEFSTRTIVPADGVKLPAVNENLANPSGNMTLSSLKSYVLGTLPTEVQTNTEDIGENTSDIEGIRGSSQAFDATAAYSAGDYCIYENVLYRFTSAKSAGAWDSAIVSVVDLPTLDGALTSFSTFVDVSSTVYLSGVSGNVNTPTLKVHTNGTIYVLNLSATTTASTSAGSNIFTATINGLPARTYPYTFATFNSSCIPMLIISNDNSVVCRALANTLSSGGAVDITGVLIPL